MDDLLNGAVEAEPCRWSGLHGGALHVEINMCRHATSVKTRERPRDIDSQHDFPCSWQFHLELAASFAGSLEWPACLAGEDSVVISRSTLPKHEGRGVVEISNIEQTTPSLRRG